MRTMLCKLFYCCFFFLTFLCSGTLAEKVVVVITGASKGIGLGIALDFAREANHEVYATMRDPSMADARLKELNNVYILFEAEFYIY